MPVEDRERIELSIDGLQPSPLPLGYRSVIDDDTPMGKLTIKLLRMIPPEKRLTAAAHLFWYSIFGGTYSVIFLARNPYEQVLMAISWGAITITCYDVISTADVRAEQEESGK